MQHTVTYIPGRQGAARGVFYSVPASSRLSRRSAAARLLTRTGACPFSPACDDAAAAGSSRFVARGIAPPLRLAPSFLAPRRSHATLCRHASSPSTSPSTAVANATDPVLLAARPWFLLIRGTLAPAACNASAPGISPAACALRASRPADAARPSHLPHWYRAAETSRVRADLPHAWQAMRIVQHPPHQLAQP